MYLACVYLAAIVFGMYLAWNYGVGLCGWEYRKGSSPRTARASDVGELGFFAKDAVRRFAKTTGLGQGWGGEEGCDRLCCSLYPAASIQYTL